MRILALLILLIISIDCYSQSEIQNDIKRIEQMVNFTDHKNEYSFTLIDSVRFKHPYITTGKTMGMLSVRNSNPSDCELKYYIIEYTNKDSITRQIYRYYSLSSTVKLVPFEPIFYFDKYVFFMKWCCPYWSVLDDRCKYMSIKIAQLTKSYIGPQ
jgi:hypothetical protein